MATQTQTQSLPQTKPKDPRSPWLWNVVLIDDDEHSYEYVIRMVQGIFGHDRSRAFKTAVTVDTDGRAVCMTTHKELAELKRDQIHAFGKDPSMAVSKGSMTAVIEPAEFGGDDSQGPPADRPGGRDKDDGQSGNGEPADGKRG